LKGGLLLLLAFGVYRLADQDLVRDYRALLDWIHVDPERKFFTDLAAHIKNITTSNVKWRAWGTAFYSLFSVRSHSGKISRLIGWVSEEIEGRWPEPR
jgi:hypothetical protein